MTTREYQICTRCVMDTSDPEIEFDAQGVCSHCHVRDEMIAQHVLTGEAGRRKLEQVVEEVRRAGQGRPYDCVIGVSGGVDSTYLAWRVKEMGLRPLAVHLDNGWDSELAVKNIENTVRLLGVDLHTHVLDWDEFKDLQLAFLRASTPDAEIPTDHAIVAVLYQTARKHGIRYILSGQNLRTESHLPQAWSNGHIDWRYIKGIHRKFGTRPLRSFPHLTWAQSRMYPAQNPRIDILNYMDYVKADALKVLQDELGWKYYGGKHYESIYTRFYQGYILPRKFGFDKRRMHFSSLVCAGEMDREQALEELKTEPYPPELQREDREFVAKKFGLTDAEFQEIMDLPPKRFWDYPSYLRIFHHPAYRHMSSLYRRTVRPLLAAARSG
ncbi:MAG TPA: N-acetyl sugar amidotransferase [Longimicrobium sp.]